MELEGYKQHPVLIIRVDLFSEFSILNVNYSSSLYIRNQTSADWWMLLDETYGKLLLKVSEKIADEWAVGFCCDLVKRVLFHVSSLEDWPLKLYYSLAQK